MAQTLLNLTLADIDIEAYGTDRELWIKQLCSTCLYFMVNIILLSQVPFLLNKMVKSVYMS